MPRLKTRQQPPSEAVPVIENLIYLAAHDPKNTGSAQIKRDLIKQGYDQADVDQAMTNMKTTGKYDFVLEDE